MATQDHSHDGMSHSHAGADHGHTHEIYNGPGSFMGREMPIVEGRDWRERAFTVGIGGYVHGHTKSQMGTIFLLETHNLTQMLIRDDADQ